MSSTLKQKEAQPSVIPVILIVEDQALDRRAIRDILGSTPNNYCYIEAASGEQALTLAKHHKPNLIILDLAMPPSGEREGLRVLANLRHEQVTSQIPVVVLTQLGAGIAAACSPYNISKFFVKWPKQSEIVAAVEKALLPSGVFGQ